MPCESPDPKLTLDILLGVRQSYSVTTTLSVKGQVVIPQPVRSSQKLKAGTDFTILTRSNGDIILRPVKAHRRHSTLADNLLALSGLPIDPERTPSRDLDL